MSFGESETQKEASRLATHRRNVADRARQTFPSDRIGGMFVAQKMSSLQKPVASKNGFVATQRRKQSRVVADSQPNCRI
jgi:hypothetical protein